MQARIAHDPSAVRSTDFADGGEALCRMRLSDISVRLFPNPLFYVLKLRTRSTSAVRRNGALSLLPARAGSPSCNPRRRFGSGWRKRRLLTVVRGRPHRRLLRFQRLKDLAPNFSFMRHNEDEARLVEILDIPVSKSQQSLAVATLFAVARAVWSLALLLLFPPPMRSRARGSY